MIAVNNEAGLWPTRSQKLILRAALLKGAEALAAWEEWKRTTNIEVLDFGSHRMIPLLYRNLMDQGVQDPLMERFKGVYRYYLYKNERLFHKAATVLTACCEAGINTILLKGCALVPLYYKESGLRPMQDFDFLVRVEHASAAMALLKQLGWNPPPRNWAPEKWIAIRHSIPFTDREGRQVDLHWHLLWECWHAGDSDYWDSALPISLRDVSTLTLSPTYQLLHICWHGVRWNETPPIRWIADAMAILKASESEIDWDLIIEKARRHRISLPLKDSFLCLKSLLRAPIPDRVIKSLESIPVSRLDQIGYEAFANPLAPPKTRRILALQLYDYLWLKKSTSMRPRLLAYARFLQAKWNINYLWQVPFYLTYRTVIRAVKRGTGHNNRGAQSAARAD